MTMVVVMMVLQPVFTKSVVPQNMENQHQKWPGTLESRKETLANRLRGIKIIPGAWRPHFPWEHIAWIKPPWDSQDYIWMDFPEAIFTDWGLLFLSHINPRLAQLSPDEPRIPWKEIPRGIAFERTLSNKIAFGGSLVKANESTVALTLYVRNKTNKPLTGIRLQTCAFLRHSKEFSEFTTDNKFVHLPERGWITYSQAKQSSEGKGKYRMVWNGSNEADRPVMVTVVRSGEQDAPSRMVAMTWEDDTYMLFSNPRHPCMHADPSLPDIGPGETATVHGRLIFYEGSLDGLWTEHFSR